MQDQLGPDRGARAAGTNRLAWRIGTLRAFVYGLIAVQLVQGLAQRETSVPYNRSYWIVSYVHGFVRRGLGGEILRRIAGSPSAHAIDVVFAIIVVSSVLALLVVVELLLRTRRDTCVALAVLIAASPFGFDYLAFQHRPDQIGVPLLVALGVALLAAPVRARMWAIGLTGAAFGVLTLIHEGAALLVVPWALLVVIMVPRRMGGPQDRPWREIGVLVGPAVAAFSIVAAFGRATPKMVSQFQHDAPRFVGAANGFPSLGYSVREAWDTVQFVPRGVLVGSAVVGVVLLVVQIAWMRGWARISVVQGAWRVRPKAVGQGALAAVALATASQFATGVDWLRWFATSGCCWLVTSAFVALSMPASQASAAAPATPRTRDGSSSRVRVSWLLPVAAVLLVLLAPLPEFVFLRDLRRLTPWN